MAASKERKPNQLIGYIRVSTDKQGKSGLGLEAQQAALREYAKQHAATIIAEYREVETGKFAARPELAKAIAHAKRCKATLVVAKLNRLSRNVAFTAALMESKVDFICCDNPHADRFTIHILAAVAQREAEQISRDTKAALAAAKARGVKLGGSRPECRKLTQDARRRGARAAAKLLRAGAVEAYADLLPTMQELRQKGHTLQAIADRLNDEGHTTRENADWKPVQVKRVLDRAAVA